MIDKRINIRANTTTIIIALGLFAFGLSALQNISTTLLLSKSKYQFNDDSNLDIVSNAPPAAGLRRKDKSLCPTPRSNYHPRYIPDHPDKEDIYSGMWWQSISQMNKHNYSQTSNLEGITFDAYFVAPRVLAPIDWLDLNVEHLSLYAKHFANFDDWGVDGVRMQNRVEEIFRRYIDQMVVLDVKKGESTSASSTCRHVTSSWVAKQSAIQQTIIIIPLLASSNDNDTYALRVRILQAAATIASLWMAGFPRVVIVGVSNNERMASQKIFDMLQSHIQIRFMELEYVEVTSGRQSNEDGSSSGGDCFTSYGCDNVPRLALGKFQQVIRQYQNQMKDDSNEREEHDDDADIHSWLGKDPLRWHNVYYTEPDLILHMRPEVTPSLASRLTKGHVIAAHRLNVLPHMDQFEDIYQNATSSVRPKMEGQLLPSKGTFASIHPLGGHSTHSSSSSDNTVCCDQGRFYPSNIHNPTNNIKAISEYGCRNWDYCGFADLGDYNNWTLVMERHRFLVNYNLMAYNMESGTGLPLVAAQQRICSVKRGKDITCAR